MNKLVQNKKKEIFNTIIHHTDAHFPYALISFKTEFSLESNLKVKILVHLLNCVSKGKGVLHINISCIENLQIKRS